MSSDADSRAHFRGSIELALLSLLAERPDHGFGLMKRLRERSGGTIELPEGTLYPILHRQTREGLLDSEKQRSERNRIVKVYKLTPKGQERLEIKRSQWLEHTRVLYAVLGLMGPESGGEVPCT